MVLAMEPGQLVSWEERFSLAHLAQFWGSGPLLFFSWIWSDPLHLFLNLFNVAFDEVVDFFLQHEFVSSEDKALIVECDNIAREVNRTLAAAHIRARFGTSERKSFNGNDLRALMQHDSALTDVLTLVRPLYERMMPCSFAADAAKARKAQQKAEDRVVAEKERAAAGGGGGGGKKAARVDADDFNTTAGISKQAAARIRKQEAALEAAAAANRTFEQRFEHHLHAMQQGIEGNYNWSAVNMLTALVEFYEFLHAKQWLADALAADVGAGLGGEGGWGPAVTQAVEKRRTDCMERSKAVAADIIRTIGVAREQTYVHDLVYGVHRIFDVVLHPLLAGMQGLNMLTSN